MTYFRLELLADLGPEYVIKENFTFAEHCNLDAEITAPLMPKILHSLLPKSLHSWLPFTGRLLLLFVGLILSSYVRHIWKLTDLHKQF